MVDSVVFVFVCVCARAPAYGDVACWARGLRRRLVNERMRVSSDSELRFYSLVVFEVQIPPVPAFSILSR